MNGRMGVRKRRAGMGESVSERASCYKEEQMEAEKVPPTPAPADAELPSDGRHRSTPTQP